jgi:hypothetical protein
MTYDLRRLRLHGLIEPIPCSRRYRVNDFGFRSAVLLTRSYSRLLRPGFAVLGSRDPPSPAALRKAVLSTQDAVDRLWQRCCLMCAQHGHG